MARDRRRTDELAPRDDVTQTGGHLAQDAQEPSLSFQPVDERDPRSRWIALGAAVLVALISFFVVGRYASDPAFYAKTVAALDEKRETVMKLVGASTGSSAAVSLLPGDAGTPIAEKLVDLSSDFLIVIAAIYLEKYLLTILGFTAFKVLIPVACLLFSKHIDSLAAAGAILADIWTDTNMPVVDKLGEEFLDYVRDGMIIEVKDNGLVEVSDG